MDNILKKKVPWRRRTQDTERAEVSPRRLGPEETVAKPCPLDDNKSAARMSYRNHLGGKPMKGNRVAWLILMGLAAVTVSTRNLAADDLYNKKQAKTEVVALPTPAEVKTLTAFPVS